MVYRDPARGSYARVARAIDELELAEGRFLPEFWALVTQSYAGVLFAAVGLPADAPARIARPIAALLREALDRAGEDEERARVQDDAEERRELLDQVAGRAGALEDGLSRPVDEPPPIARPAASVGALRKVPDVAVAALSRFAHEEDEEAAVRREDGGRHVTARLVYGAAPIAISVRAGEVIAFTATTRIAPGAGALTLEPKTFMTSIGEVFGRRSSPLGDEELDGTLVARGEARTVAVFGDVVVQNAMRALCRFDVPTLTILDGIASVSIVYEPIREAVEPVCRVLRGLHAFEPDVALLRRAEVSL